MPIAFTCPFCGAQTNVDDQYAGQSGPCAHCGRTITVPVPGAVPPASAGSSSAVVVIVILVAVVAVLLVCGGILAAMLIPAVHSAREAARSAQCSNNLRQISLAMQMYQVTHGTFPPAYTADKQGRRLHSWRVLLLPHLDREDLYRQIKLDEPWDSPHNQAVAKYMPTLYRCASSPDLGTTKTGYVVVVGQHTMFPGSNGRKMGEVKDGMSNSILVAEQRSGVNWMEPKDLEFDQMSFRIDDPQKPAIGSFHPGVANVLMGDGSIHRLSKSLDQEVLKLLLTIDDGKQVDSSSLH